MQNLLANFHPSKNILFIFVFIFVAMAGSHTAFYLFILSVKIVNPIEDSLLLGRADTRLGQGCKVVCASEVKTFKL